MDVDKYIDEILIKNNTLTEEGREGVIEDIMALKKLIKHTKETKPTKLHKYTDKGLVMVLIAGHEFFAIKHFMECSRNPATYPKNTWNSM